MMRSVTNSFGPMPIAVPRLADAPSLARALRFREEGRVAVAFRALCYEKPVWPRRAQGAACWIGCVFVQPTKDSDGRSIWTDADDLFPSFCCSCSARRAHLDGQQGQRRRHPRSPRCFGYDGLLRHRERNLRYACALIGRARAGGSQARRSSGAPRGGVGAGSVGASRLCGLRSSSVSPDVTEFLPARASLERCGADPGGVPRSWCVRKRHGVVLAAVAVAALTPQRPAKAQSYFGQNQVQYDRFQWRYLETEHFLIYYYPEEREAVMDAARMAERAYARLSRILDHQFREKKPIMLFESRNDFGQNNVTGDLGEGTGGVTEALRHRMLLNFTGDYKSFEHVLT